MTGALAGTSERRKIFFKHWSSALLPSMQTSETQGYGVLLRAGQCSFATEPFLRPTTSVFWSGALCLSNDLPVKILGDAVTLRSLSLPCGRGPKYLKAERLWCLL